jgi:hypothetical protein
VEDILSALKKVAKEKGSVELSKTDIDLIKRIAELMPVTLVAEKRSEECLKDEETADILLPGKDSQLRPVSELCLNDCDWLEESETMSFLHPDFSESLARVFCVKSKREHDEVRCVRKKINRSECLPNW